MPLICARKSVRQIVLAACCLGLVEIVSARPVSYPGGVTLMQRNDAERSSLHIHYSPTFRDSIGYRGIIRDGDDWLFHGLQYNRLARRWNWRAMQANVYVKGMAGVARHSAAGRDTRFAGAIGIAADWETRRHFVSYENRYLNGGGDFNFYQQEIQLGMAPYIGDYGDLHTWLMLKVKHVPTADDGVTATALIRLFRHEYLGELGLDENGRWMANFIIRF